MSSASFPLSRESDRLSIVCGSIGLENALKRSYSMSAEMSGCRYHPKKPDTITAQPVHAAIKNRSALWVTECIGSLIQAGCAQRLPGAPFD